MTVFDSAIDRMAERIGRAVPVRRRGRVLGLSGVSVRASLPRARVGDVCDIWPDPGTQTALPAQVVGFDGNIALLAPLTAIEGLGPDAEVAVRDDRLTVEVGDHLLGNVLDGLGRPLREVTDGVNGISVPVHGAAPAPLDRPPIDRVLPTGLRAIDGFVTLGVGQRLGVFSAAGVGKSTLMATLAARSRHDVCVIALIGERGREVREFLDKVIPPGMRSRTVVVVATADQPALQRVNAANVATAIAEYFRDRGQDALLLMDSITRVARALREIGLAAGEPPTRRGFPASVFSALPRLLERAGTASRGSITGVYTVLVEGDDMTEPVADEVRSLVDGHLVLSRQLADADHYPAIDIRGSRSRVMDAIVDRRHAEAAGAARRLLARYDDIELLVQMGEYRTGNDPEADRAVALQPRLMRFLGQRDDSSPRLEETVAGLRELLGDA